jgi:hypothetical protein
MHVFSNMCDIQLGSNTISKNLRGTDLGLNYYNCVKTYVYSVKIQLLRVHKILLSRESLRVQCKFLNNIKNVAINIINVPLSLPRNKVCVSVIDKPLIFNNSLNMTFLTDENLLQRKKKNDIHLLSYHKNI